ncbi:MAG: hypothetical protein IPJ00_09345 [Saprospirales bacterium]|nr:hypothetical protein [Saprospirales bacterium]
MSSPAFDQTQTAVNLTLSTEQLRKRKKKIKEFEDWLKIYRAMTKKASRSCFCPSRCNCCNWYIWTFYSIIEGKGLKEAPGSMLYYFFNFTLCSIYLSYFNFIKSIINKKWIEFLVGFFAILLGCLIYSVAFLL